MTDEQLAMLYEIERTEEGYPKLKMPGADAPPSARALHRRHCYLLGITEPEVIEQLWNKLRADVSAAQRGGGI